MAEFFKIMSAKLRPLCLGLKVLVDFHEAVYLHLNAEYNSALHGKRKIYLDEPCVVLRMNNIFLSPNIICTWL